MIKRIMNKAIHAWDPDYIKVTPCERLRIAISDREIKKGKCISEDQPAFHLYLHSGKRKFRLFINYKDRSPRTVNILAESLRDKIIKYSDGSINTYTAENMAYKCIAKLDFNNKYQMHRSLDSYALALIAHRNQTGDINTADSEHIMEHIRKIQCEPVYRWPEDGKQRKN